MTQSTNTAAAAAASNPEVNGQEVSAARKQRNKLILHVAIILVATLAIWFVPAPEGVDPRGMHMLAIFVGTILGLILQPLPTPSVAQVNTITSAMFLTAMAGNPLAQKFAHDHNINLDWGTWALAAIVPGLAALIVMPWIMSKIYPPTIKKTPDAPEHARQELHEMGPMSSKEWIMLGTFVMLLVLWITGTALGIDATSAAFFGIAILLVTKVLTWKDMAKNSSAWSTLIFFAVLVGMADHLKKLKVVDWIGQQAAHSVSGMAWPMAFAILVLAYFFIHYMFASNTAQIVALYAVFLGAAVAAGVPPMFAALFLGFMGNLIGGITHYASGPAGVYYGSGYFSVGEWFKIGFMAAIVNLVVWGAVGTAWLFALGFAN